MTKSHTELKNKYIGQDIWVLGAGKSLDYIKPNFFQGKVVIATNRIWRKFPATYVVFKHYQFIEDAIKNGQQVIASKHDCGDTTFPVSSVPGDYWVFTHKNGRFNDRDKNFTENLAAVGQDDDIFVSWSTITSSIHIAAYMGAKNIVIAGHDCCYLDDKPAVDNYQLRLPGESDEAYNMRFKEWLYEIQQESIKLRARLTEVYRCNICTLSPFIGLNHEGHNISGGL